MFLKFDYVHQTKTVLKIKHSG